MRRPSDRAQFGPLSLPQAQSHRTPRIVLVEVDQNDALPGVPSRPAPETGTSVTWRNKAGGSVVGDLCSKPVAVVARQQPHQRVSPDPRRKLAPVSIIATPVSGWTNTLHRLSWGGAEAAHGVGEIDNAATRGVHPAISVSTRVPAYGGGAPTCQPLTSDAHCPAGPSEVRLTRRHRGASVPEPKKRGVIKCALNICPGAIRAHRHRTARSRCRLCPHCRGWMGASAYPFGRPAIRAGASPPVPGDRAHAS